MAELKYKGQSIAGAGGDGKPFKANGAETDTIAAGDNIVLEQEGNVLTISAVGSGPVTSSVYGVTWDGSAATTWARTDDAALFSDPVPYMAGMSAEECSSPFDTIQPWAGMVRVTDETCGELVKIPKFYYSLTQEGAGLSIKISSTQQEGFSCSPAHMDRGDGKGERDVVYVGRYHCASDYKSTTGVLPKVSITRAAARSAIHALGDTVWQSDFATMFTIWLLYLVEFANWNSQSVIGYGCGNGSSVQSMGASDSMPYHTGTMQSDRTTYGVGIQYRSIEGLFDNCQDWCDGCYYDSNGLNLIANPSDFNDTGNGTAIGIPSSGYPSAFSISDNAGYPAFYPASDGGSMSTCSCDYWGFADTRNTLATGGGYSQSHSRGLFYVTESKTTYSFDYIGARLMKLPDPT